MLTKNTTTTRILSQLPADQNNTRVIDNPLTVVMCNVPHTCDKPFVRRGDVVTLTSYPQPHGLTFQVTYFIFNNERGFIIEKAQ